MKHAARRANAEICALPNFHNQIPLGTIFSALESNGLVPLQEDYTKWDGLLCGEEGRATIHLGDASDTQRIGGSTFYAEVNHDLILTWYQMPSGRYEVVAYVS